MNAHAQILKPNIAAITAFLYALFDPAFVHAFPDAWIEIVCIYPDGPIKWRFFSAHNVEPIVEYIVKMNERGHNCYVGAALRHGEKPKSGRAGKAHFCAARYSWADLDQPGDHERAVEICRREGLLPGVVVTTGTIPHTRAQVHFLNREPLTEPKDVEDANTALCERFEGDAVQNCDRLVRVGGSISFPPAHKQAKGYVPELTTVQIKNDTPSYSAEALRDLQPAKPKSAGSGAPTNTGVARHDYFDSFERYANAQMREAGRLTDGDMQALLEKHQNGGGQGWHNDLVAITWELLVRGYEPFAIQMVIGSACKKGFDDPDIGRLVNKKWEEFQAQRREAERSEVEERVAKAKVPSALALAYYNELSELPPKFWIMKFVLAHGETSNWFGPPGVGKSVLMTDLAFHVAWGCDWRGYRSKERCGVVYIALERGALVKRRLSAYMRKYGAPDLPIAVASNVVDLKNKGCVKLIVDTIREAETRFDCKVGLIVIDTISKGIAAGGGDEDKSKDVNVVLANLRRVEELTTVHIACVGHTGKDEERGHRGSNANLGDVDLMVQISGGEGAVKTATVIKINDGMEGPLTHYKIESALLGTDEDGDAITTAIISDDAAEAAQEAKVKKGLSGTQRRAMELLTRCINDNGRPPPASQEFPRNVRVVALEEWHTACERGGLSSAEKKEDRDRAFRRAKDDLQTFNRTACLDGLVWLVRDDG
ncbi:AAA family ATPase [Bradyrhizobium sp. 169]|uniref:AAA family ATPase n=1 Tax=Bradyrhizobium sp. 169 TaxID=2782640 RepID=UPI001FF9E5C5|nr:AAA family ATPase [Bradyrhizobium sp. 169]